MSLEKLIHISVILVVEWLMMSFMYGVAGVPLGRDKRTLRHRRHGNVKHALPYSDTLHLSVELGASTTLLYDKTTLTTILYDETTLNSANDRGNGDYGVSYVAGGANKLPKPCKGCPAWYFEEDDKKNSDHLLPVNLMILPLVIVFLFVGYILIKATHWCKEDIKEADEKGVKVNPPPDNSLSEVKSLTSEIRSQAGGSVRSGSTVSWRDDVKGYKRSKSEVHDIRRDRLARVKMESRSVSVDGSVSDVRKRCDSNSSSRMGGKNHRPNTIHGVKPNKPPVRPLKLDRRSQLPHKKGGKMKHSPKGPYRTGSGRSNRTPISSPNSPMMRLAYRTVPHSDSLSPATTCSSGYSSSVFRYDHQRAGSTSSVESRGSRRKRHRLKGHHFISANTPDSCTYPSSDHIPFTPSDETFLPPFKYACDIHAPPGGKQFHGQSPGSITSLPIHLRSESISGHSSIHHTPTGSVDRLGMSAGHHRTLEKKDSSSYGSLTDNTKSFEESSGDLAIKTLRDHRVYSMDGTLLDLHNKQHEALSLRKKLVMYLAENQKISTELQDMLQSESKNSPSPASDTPTPSGDGGMNQRHKAKSWCANGFLEGPQEKAGLNREVNC